ncbi:MAG: glycosyltransferase [Halioglobus sp.]
MSAQRPRVLLIDHYVPHYDKDAGSRSTWLYLRFMVEMGYNVKFIGANFFSHQPYTAEMQQMGVEVLVGEYMAHNIEGWLEDNASYIDAVYVHRPHVAEQFLPLLEKLNPKPPVIYFGHDLHYLRLHREHVLSGDDAVRRECDRWRNREFRVFDRVDHIYYPSDAEVTEITRQFPRKSAHAIPLYVLDGIDAPAYSAQDREGMIFVAGFNHPPNLDGLRWFVEEIMPKVRERCPGLLLHVVGSNMPDEVLAMASNGIAVHGFLSDKELADLYGRVKMVVVPLRFGAGVKGKVVDSLQHRIPCVTTSIGAEGLPDADTVLHVADDANAFAAAIAEVEEGAPAVKERLDRFDAYLENNFGKRKAAAILRRDFGEPLRQRAVP